MRPAIMSNAAALNNQALAVSIVVIYLVLSFVSIQSHAKRGKYNAIQLRVIALLREAARSSVRSKQSTTPDDRFAEASKAACYVTAVQSLLSVDEISRLASTNIDELRNHVDKQLTCARSELNQKCNTKRDKLKPSYMI